MTPIETAQAFVRQPGRHFIGGRWIADSESAPIPVIDPASEEVLTHIPAGGEQAVAEAVAAARAAFVAPAWRGMPAAERERLLLALAAAIEARGDEFAAIETLDMGMPISVARVAAVAGAVSAIRFNAGWARRLGGATVPVSAPGAWHGYSLREPLGVAALIVPWNAPLPMTCNKLSAALAAGCTLVLKPAELAPLSALRLMELVAEVGFPDGVVNLVTGYGAEAGAALVRHPDVDKISFTGSTATGQGILRESVGMLKRVSLELGGKSPVVVFPDADLDRAIPAIAMGIFGNSGQICAAGSRLFVHGAVYDRVVDGLAAFAQRLTVGPGLDPATRIGPLVSAGQRDRVWSYIEAGRAAGAQVATGGGKPASKGYFIQPTIFVNATPDMAIVREEIFGPVLSVMRFDDDGLDKVIAAANDTVYGLSSYVWTRDLGTAHLMAQGIRAGSVKINGSSGMEFALPFGGHKQSGVGRENGAEGAEAFTELKSVTIAL